MRTKILALLATTFVILAFSGCDFFNSKEGQTSVINFPAGTTGSYTIKTDFPAGSTGQLATINHKDTSGSADELVVTYKVTDSNADGVLNTSDCAGFVLNFNAIPIVTKLTGIDTGVTDARTIFIGGDSAGNCTNTTFTLQDGGPKALALTDHAPEIRTNSGIPGFIRYGTKASPVSQWNFTGTSADVTIISSLGYCYEQNTSWDDATQSCKPYSSGGGNTGGGTGGGGGNETCSDFYYDNGSCRNMCTSQDGTSSRDNGACQNFGTGSCWEEDRGNGEKCQFCPDPNYPDNPSVTCWGGEDINPGTVPDEDRDRTCEDMRKQVSQNERDLGRRIEKDIAKRLARETKNDQKAIERTQKMIERGIRKGFPEEELERLRTDLENLQQRVDDRTVLVQKANDLSAAFRRDVENTKTSITNLCSQTNLTWNDMDSGWKKLNKLNFYWTLADVVDTQVNVAQSFGESNDFRREISRVRYMYTKFGASTPPGLDELEYSLDALEQAGVDLIAFAEDIGVQVRELSNSGDDWETNEAINDLGNDMRDAAQDYWDLKDDWYWEEPWRVLDEVRFKAECLQQTGYMKEELIMIRGDITVAGEFADAMDRLGVTSLAVDIDGARRVIENGLAMIDNMEAEVSSACDELEDFGPGGGPDFYRFERFWPAMEHLGRVAQRYFTRLVDYILDNPDAYDEVVADIGEEVVNEMIDFSREDMHGGGDFQGDYSVIWEDVYEIDNADVFSGLEQKLSGEIASMLQRGQIDAAIMEEIASLIVNAVFERMTAAIMNQLDVLGADIGNMLMENNAIVAQKAVEVKEGLSASDKALIEEAQSTVYVNSSTAEECASILGELKSATETGDNTGIFTQRLKECVDRANEESVKGQNAVEFSDCRISESDDTWYVNYCVDSKQKGIVSGYKDEHGNLTGEVKPGNDVTYAEVTKMAAEACGKGESDGTPADSRAHGQWFERYVKTFENAGIGALVKVSDWNGAATRKQAFAILAGMCDVDPVSYRNVYPDLSASDPLADYMQALYDLGVVTGEGDGRLNGDGLINRAAVMKIMTVSVDAAEEVQFSTELLEVDFDPEEFLNSFGGFAPPPPGYGGEDYSGDPGSGYFDEGSEDYEELEGDEDFEEFEDDLFEGFDDIEFEDDFDEISAVFAPLPL